MARTDTAVDTTLENAVVELLGSSSLGLRSDQIRNRLAQSGITIDEARLVVSLRRLQDADKLAFAALRWCRKCRVTAGGRPRRLFTQARGKTSAPRQVRNPGVRLLFLCSQLATEHGLP